MKKYTFCLFLIVCCFTSQAQNIHTGFRSGLSYSGNAFKATDIAGNSVNAWQLSKLSIAEGVTVNFALSKDLSFESEVMIENKGNASVSGSTNLWNLHFPEYLRYSMPIANSQNTFFIEGGPYFSWLLKSAYTSKTFEKNERDIRGAYTNTDYGFGTGLGIRQKITQGFLEYNLRYECSLNNSLKDAELAPGISDATTAAFYRVLLLSCQFSFSLQDMLNK